MLLRLIAFLIAKSPLARRVLWRWWYNRLAREVTAPDWTFMNYGLVWPEPETAPPLDAGEETDRLCAQLYHRVARPGLLDGKAVLEVGCGRGGGASYVARYHKPSKLTAMDYSEHAVAWCRRRHRAPNLRFIVGDALSLPFPDGTFDAILNVESSHCYASMPTFLREVARVLRPGGTFLFADLRSADDMPDLESLLAAQPQLEVVEQEDITASVAAALLADDARKRARILQLCPPKQRKLFEQFAGLAGSVIQRNLSDRAILYQRFVLLRNR
ncbi:MAG: class I SAM-dependent methyltransferase [Verrucomicrobia bacterium]|nr:class I SAM-dependent methyltransferase [Verrucomicrobiota bacterium]